MTTARTITTGPIAEATFCSITPHNPDVNFRKKLQPPPKVNNKIIYAKDKTY